MDKFEVGGVYYAGCGIDPIKVLRRTEKMILVTNGGCTWRMKIRTGKISEYATDSLIPKAYRFDWTYWASRKEDG